MIDGISEWRLDIRKADLIFTSDHTTISRLYPLTVFDRMLFTTEMAQTDKIAAADLEKGNGNKTSPAPLQPRQADQNESEIEHQIELGLAYENDIRQYFEKAILRTNGFEKLHILSIKAYATELEMRANAIFVALERGNAGRRRSEEKCLTRSEMEITQTLLAKYCKLHSSFAQFMT